jgi:hypothetical protein
MTFVMEVAAFFDGKTKEQIRVLDEKITHLTNKMDLFERLLSKIGQDVGDMKVTMLRDQARIRDVEEKNKNLLFSLAAKETTFNERVGKLNFRLLQLELFKANYGVYIEQKLKGLKEYINQKNKAVDQAIGNLIDEDHSLSSRITKLEGTESESSEED